MLEQCPWPNHRVAPKEGMFRVNTKYTTQFVLSLSKTTTKKKKMMVHLGWKQDRERNEEKVFITNLGIRINCNFLQHCTLCFKTTWRMNGRQLQEAEKAGPASLLADDDDDLNCCKEIGMLFSSCGGATQSQCGCQSVCCKNMHLSSPFEWCLFRSGISGCTQQQNLWSGSG